MGLKRLLKDTDPELVRQVPDVGWVTRGDVELTDFVHEHRARIEALHFKEFTFDDHFAELGRGIVDFPGVYDLVKDTDMWIVAEQDTCTGKPVDSARINADYLRALRK